MEQFGDSSKAIRNLQSAKYRKGTNQEGAQVPTLDLKFKSPGKKSTKAEKRQKSAGIHPSSKERSADKRGDTGRLNNSGILKKQHSRDKSREKNKIKLKINLTKDNSYKQSDQE